MKKKRGIMNFEEFKDLSILILAISLAVNTYFLDRTQYFLADPTFA